MIFDAFKLHVARRLLICWLLFAPPTFAEQLNLRELGQSEGLANLAVTALAQDARGYIWAGTENGLYRYDGVRFQRFGIAEQLTAIRGLLARGKRLWIVGDRGLWILQDGKVLPIRPQGKNIEPPSYPQPMAWDGASLWVISNWQLQILTEKPDGTWDRREVFDEAMLAQHKNLRSITSVVIDARGDAWFGCGLALCQMHAGKLAFWGEEHGVPTEVWHWLQVGGDGTLWARGARHILQLSPGRNRFADRTDYLAVQDAVGLYPLAEDSEHRMLASERNALARWSGHAWTRFEDGLPAGGRVLAMLSDREGGVWLGKMGAGILQWQGYGLWENWSSADGLPHPVVWGFARTGAGGERTLYAATGTGLAAFDEKTRRFRSVAATRGQEIGSVAVDQGGNLWAGTSRGRLFHSEGKLASGVKSIDYPSRSAIFRLFGKHSADLWVLSWDGLFRHGIDGTKMAPELQLANDKSPIGDLTDGCEDRDGSLWVAGARGIAHRVAGKWETPYLSQERVDQIACLRDGSLAVSGEIQGLRLLTWVEGSLRETNVRASGLAGRVTVALLEDSRGWLWIGHDAGVAVWDRHHWRYLERSNGLAWNDISTAALFEDDDGSIWIGTSKGISHILDPVRLFHAEHALVDIDSISQGGKPFSLGRPVTFSPSHEPIEIGLAAPLFRDRHALRMEYRLPGFDDDWHALAHPDVGLTGLPPGDYRLEARMVNVEMGEAFPASAIEFKIDAPWWDTRIAKAAALLFLSALFYGAYRLRIRAHLQNEQRLSQLVAARTHELEASRDQLRDLATKDALTGVWNRRALDEILLREVNRSVRERQPLAIAIADIDHFKRVNDVHGHPAGDAVLREFAARMTAGLRPYDSVGRYGGEEFILVLPGLDISQPEHRKRLETIHASIAAEPMSVGTVTCSMGVSCTGEASDVAALIADADAALYRAKNNGRDRIEWVDTS